MLARTVEAVLRRQLPRSLGTMTRTISTKEQAPEEPKEGADRNSVLLLTFADLPSAAPAGTVFTGLSIFKDKPDPVARPDHEYPSWLFELLDDPAFRSRKTVMVGDVAWARLSVGLLCLWVALATGFSMVFLDSRRPTRIWVRASSSC